MLTSFLKSGINFFLIILSIFLLYIRLSRFQRHPILWYIASFPVFFLHESAHYLIALFLLARPEFPSFTIKSQKGGWIMGSVACRNINFFNALPVGLAPLFLLVPAYMICFKLTVPSGLKILSLSYLLPASIPSKQDLKVAFSLFSILFWSMLLLSLYYLSSCLVPLLRQWTVTG